MAKLGGSLGDYSFAIHERDGFRCRYCGLDGSASFTNWLCLCRDHLLPKGHPNRDNPDYMVTACLFCNNADTFYFSYASARGIKFEGLSRAELVEQRLSSVLKTRAKYEQFWETNVKPRASGGAAPVVSEV